MTYRSPLPRRSVSSSPKTRDGTAFDVALRAALSEASSIIDLTGVDAVLTPARHPSPLPMPMPVPLPMTTMPMPTMRGPLSNPDLSAAAISAERIPRREHLIRLCLASLFAVNGVAAFVDPEPFASLLLKAPLLGALPTPFVDALVWFAGANDLALAVAIMVMKRRRFVYVWMALWLASVAAVKVLSFF